MPRRALFLDIGETLLTTVPSRFEVYAQAARRRGKPMEAERMLELMQAAHHGLPMTLGGAFRYSDPWFEAFIARIFADELGFSGDHLAEITAELFERFEDPATYHVFPGTRELLAGARERGLVLGVISNWSARLPRLLERLELFEAFDFVLSSAIEGVEKPAPELFERALERAGVAPDEALHAGDHPRLDVEAAQAVGLEAVLVDHAGARHGPPGTRRVGTLEELAAVILGRES